VDTHPTVEMTLYHQPENKRMLAGLLNMQKQHPQIPVSARVRIRVAGDAKRIVHLPDCTERPFRRNGEYTEFDVEPFGVFAMFSVEYE